MLFPDGTLVQGWFAPAVYYIDKQMRRHVPDSETVDALGGWGAIRHVPDGLLLNVPLGLPYPSVNGQHPVVPAAPTDGTLIQSPPDPAVYVMQGGHRRWIPDPETFQAGGYDWNAVLNISQSAMDAIPKGDPIPSVLASPSHIAVNTGDTFLGAGHFMSTRARLTKSTGLLIATTRTYTVTALGGFHGGVSIIAADAQDFPIGGGQTPIQRYGVSGRWLGQSDRTDVWNHAFDPNEAANAVTLRVFHTWAADDFQVILDHWVTTGKKVADLVTSVGQVAKVFTGGSNK